MMVATFFLYTLKMIYLFWKKGVAYYYSFPWRKEQAPACLMSNMTEKLGP